jgi:predicted RecB family nuclease
MGIPNATAVQLQEEGIDTVADLADFDKTPSSRLLLTYAVRREGYLIRTLERLQVRRLRRHLLC